MSVLQNIHLRRIQWAIFSPSLLSYPFCAEYVRDEQHRHAIILLLEQLDAVPSPVDEHFLELGYMPMGKYFEQLLFFILEKDPRYEIVLKNYQIKEGNITIGELDLIVKDTVTNELAHWEICLKYYLQSSQTPEHSAMIGPNAKDNLAKKMRKLQEHQMKHSSRPLIQSIINSQHIDIKLFIKGQFFYHFNSKKTLPNSASPNHECGWWCHFSDAKEMLDPILQWTTCNKPNWIGRLETIDQSEFRSANHMFEFLENHFQDKADSLLCIGMKNENGTWKEATRGFIVNNSWPNPIPLNP